jgi:NAD-dependent DNA ligase
MGVEGFKKGRISKLVEQGAVSKIVDLWKIKRKRLESIDGFGKKGVDKLMSELTKMRENRNLVQLMAASNLMGRGLSLTVLELIVSNFPIIFDDYESIKEDQLMAIHGVGKVRAKLFLKRLPMFADFLEQIGLRFADFERPVPVIEEAKDKDLDGTVIVFTRWRPTEEQKKKLIDRGARITGSVSGNTTLVAVKDITSSSASASKAQELGISIVSAEEFIATYFS